MKLWSHEAPLRVKSCTQSPLLSAPLLFSCSCVRSLCSTRLVLRRHHPWTGHSPCLIKSIGLTRRFLYILLSALWQASSTRSGAGPRSSSEAAPPFSLYLAQGRGYPLQGGSAGTPASDSDAQHRTVKKTFITKLLPCCSLKRINFFNSCVPTLQPLSLLTRATIFSPSSGTTRCCLLSPYLLSASQALPPPHTHTHVLVFLTADLSCGKGSCVVATSRETQLVGKQLQGRHHADKAFIVTQVGYTRYRFTHNSELGHHLSEWQSSAC